jgi:CDP-glycerol glycerophosphotransferase
MNPLDIEKRIAVLESRLNAYMGAQSLIHVSKIYTKTKTVIFVGTKYFGDNIKYAYLAFQKFAKLNNIATYYLTEDPVQQKLLKSFELPYLSHTEITHAEILLSAKVAVLDDSFPPNGAGGVIPHALIQGAKFVQLWHGIPLKEIGLRNFCPFETMAASGPFETFVATNASSESFWAQRFSFSQFVPIGYPRNDVLFREPTPEDLINVDSKTLAAVRSARREGRIVILYVPTNRDHIGAAWFERAEIKTFASHCEKHGHLLVVNLHPNEQSATSTLRQNYPGLHFLEPTTDVYPILKYADIVVTDYSSLAFDFLLTDRPIIFYRPDHEDYVSKSRHLISGREHYTPGYVTFTMKDLISATDQTAMNVREQKTDPYKDARMALRKELFDHCDGLSGDRVSELIIKHLDAT